MKRYKATIVEATIEARNFVKDYIQDQLTKYEASLTQEVIDNLVQDYLSGFDQEYLDTLTQTKIDKGIQIFTDSLIPAKRKQILSKIGDSIEKCPQLGKKVIFIDPEMTGNKVKQLIQLCNVIQFGRTFFHDDGEKAVLITKENYKDVPYLEWLTEVPEKYIVEEIN